MDIARFTARRVGPLDSHRKYIEHIALANAVEYFDRVQANQEHERATTPERYAELRLFLNAIESINNIAEYVYWERNPLGTRTGVYAFAERMRSTEPCLQQLADLANAYKHCVRASNQGPSKGATHAKDLAAGILTGAVEVHEGGTVTVRTSASFDIDAKHKAVLENAWQFWLGYVNDEAEVLGDGAIQRRSPS